MIKNIPNKYNQTMLINKIDQNHSNKYDFFYLPIDFKVNKILCSQYIHYYFEIIRFHFHFLE